MCERSGVVMVQTSQLKVIPRPQRLDCDPLRYLSTRWDGRCAAPWEPETQLSRFFMFKFFVYTMQRVIIFYFNGSRSFSFNAVRFR